MCHFQMIQFGWKEVPPGINLPITPPTLILMNEHSNIPKTQNGQSSRHIGMKISHFFTDENIVEVAEKKLKF